MIKKFLNNDTCMKKIILINFVFLAVVFCFIWTYGIKSIKKYYIDRMEYSNNYTYSIYGNNALYQSFVCNTEDSDGFELPVDTVRGRYYGSFKVQLMNADGKIIQEWKTKKSILVDGDWVEYRLDKPLKAGGKYSILVIAEELDKANRIEIRSINNPSIINSRRAVEYIDSFYNNDVAETMPFSLFKTHSNIFVFISIILLWIIVNYLWFMRKRSIEEYAHWVIMLFGMVMMLVLSPGSANDEDFHYYSALELSNIVMGRENISCVEKEYEYDFLTDQNSNDNFINVYEGISNHKKINTDSTNIFVGDRPSGARINILSHPVSHIIPAIGMTVGRILHFNNAQLYEIARLFNLLAYVCIGSFAVKIIPKRKDMLLLYLINPMAMQEATSLSYDAIINGLSILFVTYIVFIVANNKKIKWTDMVFLTALLVLFGPIKNVYYAHYILLLFIPVESFNGRKKKIIDLSISAVALVLCHQLVNSIQRLVVSKHDYMVIDDKPLALVGNTQSYYTIADAIKAPLEFVKISFRTINENGFSIFKEIFGSRLSVNIMMPEYIAIVFIVILIISAFKDEENTSIDKRLRNGLIICFIMESALLFSAGFIMTTYGMNVLVGIQGRYFIPCILPLLFGISCSAAGKRINGYQLAIICAFIYTIDVIVLSS